jgi:hypothetical protein
MYDTLLPYANRKPLCVIAPGTQFGREAPGVRNPGMHLIQPGCGKPDAIQSTPSYEDTHREADH